MLPAFHNTQCCPRTISASILVDLTPIAVPSLACVNASRSAEETLGGLEQATGGDSSDGSRRVGRESDGQDQQDSGQDDEESGIRLDVGVSGEGPTGNVCPDMALPNRSDIELQCSWTGKQAKHHRNAIGGQFHRWQRRRRHRYTRYG